MGGSSLYKMAGCIGARCCFVETSGQEQNRAHHQTLLSSCKELVRLALDERHES